MVFCSIEYCSGLFLFLFRSRNLGVGLFQSNLGTPCEIMVGPNPELFLALSILFGKVDSVLASESCTFDAEKIKRHAFL